MQITTKFNVGDFVRVIDNPEVIFSIKGIEIFVKDDKTSIYYRTGETYLDDYGDTLYSTIIENRLKKVKIIDEEIKCKS